jgi:hypothetical protein
MRCHLIPLMSLACFACGDGPSTAPSPSITDLAGTWVITRWERTAVANPAKRQDLVAAGYAGTLTISSSGAFTFQVTLLGGAGGTETGMITVHGDTLTYDGEADEVGYTLTLGNRTMTWVAIEVELNDVDGDGSPEDARETVGFGRS